MTKDEIFRETIKTASDFKFSAQVAGVFDDMVGRSVPFYDEMQRMIGELAADYAQPDTGVYDLGCSTGRTLFEMENKITVPVLYTGVDDSAEMLIKCGEKLKAAGFDKPHRLVEADLAEDFSISNASVAVLCLTLQFIRPLKRLDILKTILNGLVPGGALILVEKILAEDNRCNREFIKYYYDMKRRNNYSEMEIAQKREALENVLIPYKLSENLLLLKEAGFEYTEVFFKWYNFTGVIAIKK